MTRPAHSPTTGSPHWTGEWKGQPLLALWYATGNDTTSWREGTGRPPHGAQPARGRPAQTTRFP